MSPSRAKKKWPKSEPFGKFLKPTGTQGTEQRLWSYLDHQTLGWRKEKNIFAFEGEKKGRGTGGPSSFPLPVCSPLVGSRNKAMQIPRLCSLEKRSGIHQKKSFFKKYAQFVGVLVKDIRRYGFPLMIPPRSLLLLLPPGRKEEEGEGRKENPISARPSFTSFIYPPKKRRFFLRVKKGGGKLS